MITLDELRAELVAIQRELDALPSDAFDERVRLRDRQREIRAEARRIRDSDRAALESELIELTAAWDRLAGDRIDIVRQAGDLSAGGNFGFTTDAMKINEKIDAAGDRDQIEQRIREIKRKLA